MSPQRQRLTEIVNISEWNPAVEMSAERRLLWVNRIAKTALAVEKLNLSSEQIDRTLSFATTFADLLEPLCYFLASFEVAPSSDHAMVSMKAVHAFKPVMDKAVAEVQHTFQTER